MLLNIETPLFDLLEKLHLFPRWSTVKASFALIAIDHDGERQYLLQWNPKWHCYNFIGGKVQRDENGEDEFAVAIRREIKEEMGVDLEGVMVEQEIKQVWLWQFSEHEKRMKPYHFSIFAIQFFPDLLVDRQIATRSLRWLSSKHENAFVSQREVTRLLANSGKPISKTVRRILVELGEISA